MQRLAHQMDLSNDDFGSQGMIAEQKAIEKQIREERNMKRLKTSYELYWTRDVTPKNFKISHETFKSLSEAQLKFDQTKRSFRGDPDNAVILGRLGKVLDDFGERSLARSLIEEMQRDFKKKLEQEDDGTKSEANAEEAMDTSENQEQATPGEPNAAEEV